MIGLQHRVSYSVVETSGDPRDLAMLRGDVNPMSNEPSRAHGKTSSRNDQEKPVKEMMFEDNETQMIFE
jgi:hypothetical protein